MKSSPQFRSCNAFLQAAKYACISDPGFGLIEAPKLNVCSACKHPLNAFPAQGPEPPKYHQAKLRARFFFCLIFLWVALARVFPSTSLVANTKAACKETRSKNCTGSPGNFLRVYVGTPNKNLFFFGVYLDFFFKDLRLVFPTVMLPCSTEIYRRDVSHLGVHCLLFFWPSSPPLQLPEPLSAAHSTTPEWRSKKSTTFRRCI